jgi:hypothetical protein
VPALLMQAKTTSARELGAGATYRVVKLSSYEIDLHIWTFDTAKFHVKVEQQSASEGNSIDAFLRWPGDVLAANGGFFDIDSRSRLSPSGLLIVDRTMVKDVNPKAGSGVIFATDSTVGIVPRQDVPREGLQSAVQCGPLLVDPGGRMGIRRNDFRSSKQDGRLSPTGLDRGRRGRGWFEPVRIGGSPVGIAGERGTWLRCGVEFGWRSLHPGGLSEREGAHGNPRPMAFA